MFSIFSSFPCPRLSSATKTTPFMLEKAVSHRLNIFTAFSPRLASITTCSIEIMGVQILQTCVNK